MYLVSTIVIRKNVHYWRLKFNDELTIKTNTSVSSQTLCVLDIVIIIIDLLLVMIFAKFELEMKMFIDAIQWDLWHTILVNFITSNRCDIHRETTTSSFLQIQINFLYFPIKENLSTFWNIWRNWYNSFWFSRSDSPKLMYNTRSCQKL